MIREYKKYGAYIFCPCCNYPTLTEEVGYEICPLCSWEDDGQSDDEADRILGGPNSDYSLTEARDNFKKYYTMYRPSDKVAFESYTSPHEKALKEKIIEEYERLFKIKDVIEKEKLLLQIKHFEAQL